MSEISCFDVNCKQKDSESRRIARIGDIILSEFWDFCSDFCKCPKGSTFHWFPSFVKIIIIINNK